MEDTKKTTTTTEDLDQEWPEWPEEPEADWQARSGSPAKTEGSKGISLQLNRTAVTAIAAILIIGASFLGGMQYQKQLGTSNTTRTQQAGMFGNMGAADQSQDGSSQGGQGGFGGMGGGMRGGGTIGEVSAVSSSSITITNAQTGNQTTYAITNSTTIQSGSRSSASVSDIDTGDMVMVMASSGDTSTASTIIINPSFGGRSQNRGGNSLQGIGSDSQTN